MRATKHACRLASRQAFCRRSYCALCSFTRRASASDSSGLQAASALECTFGAGAPSKLSTCYQLESSAKEAVHVKHIRTCPTLRRAAPGLASLHAWRTCCPGLSA